MVAAAPVMVAPTPQAPPNTARVVAATPSIPATPTTPAPAQLPGSTLPQPQRGPSTAVKGMIATALGIFIIFMVWFLLDRMASNRDKETLYRLTTLAAKEGTTEVPVNRKELDILLNGAVNVSSNEHRTSIYSALRYAKATDNTDIDASIIRVATSREMLAEVKKVLLEDVIRLRNNPSAVPPLLDFAQSSTDTKGTSHALKAIRNMADEMHFESILKILTSASSAEVRTNAEDVLATIIGKSNNADRLAATLSQQYSTATTQDVRLSMLRLMGRCGGEKALSAVRSILAEGDSQKTIAAINALGSWGDNTGFPVLLDFIKESQDPAMRARAFDAAQKFMAPHNESPDAEEKWTQLANQAKSPEEQLKLIQGLANVPGDWPLKLVETFTKSDDNNVSAKAKRAIDHMNELRKSKD